jgi:hypothetical protein
MPKALVALTLCLALSFFYFRGVWAHPGSSWIGIPGDAQQFIWFTDWTQFAVLHGQNPLHSTYIDAPSGVNLMWNTSIVFPSLLMTPVTATLGPVVAYNLLATLGVALSAWTAILAFARFTDRWVGAVVGGVMYGFSPYMAAHAIGHLHLVLALFPPLLLILLDEIFVRQRWRPLHAGALLGTLGAAQLLTSEELLLSGALMAVVGLLVLLVLCRSYVREHARHALMALAAATAVGALFAAFPLEVQFLGPQRLTSAPLHPAYFNDFLNTIVPTAQQFNGPRVEHFLGNGAEWNGYVGIPLLIIITYVVVRHRRSRLVLLAFGVGLVATVLSWGGHLHIDGTTTALPLPGGILAHLPLFNQLLFDRLSVFADLMWTLLLAIAVNDALGGRSRLLRGGLAALIALSVLSWVPQPAYITTQSAPRFFLDGGVARIPSASTILVAPFTTSDNNTNPMAWQAAANMRFRMVEGYAFIPEPGGKSSISPPPSATQAALESIRAIGSAPDAGQIGPEMLRELDLWQVHTVVVGPMDHQEAAVRFLVEVFHQTPEKVDGVFVWWSIP